MREREISGLKWINSDEKPLANHSLVECEKCARHPTVGRQPQIYTFDSCNMTALPVAYLWERTAAWCSDVAQLRSSWFLSQYASPVFYQSWPVRSCVKKTVQGESVVSVVSDLPRALVIQPFSETATRFVERTTIPYKECVHSLSLDDDVDRDQENEKTETFTCQYVVSRH